MNIVLTGGGTAGHVTPNITLLPELKKHFKRIDYIGSKTGIEKQLIQKEKIPYHEITTTKFVRKNIFKNFCIPFLLWKGYKEAKKVLSAIKPNIVFSKGGYVSVPVILAAKKLHIPIMIHESDLTMGLANKISSKYAIRVCTTFPETAKHMKHNKGVYTGVPIPKHTQTQLNFANLAKNDEKLYNFLRKLQKNKPLLLITGGSLGAQFINEQFEKEATNLLNKYYVVHITGKNHQTKISHQNYFQTEFTYIMPYCMQQADFVISRAGSNSIFELASMQKPMLLIPLPKGNSRGDQVDNAKYFAKNNWAYSCTQSELTTSTATLQQRLALLEKNKVTLQENLKKAKFENGTHKIIQLLLTYANNVKDKL